MQMFRILVAEGDEVTRSLLERTLYEGGYEPLLAGSCAQALELLERKYVDLIVMDWLLPDADGSALLGPLRRGGSHVPVLVISARRGLSDMRRCYALGADDFLAKPVEREELLLRIGALLRRAKIAASKRLTVGGLTLDAEERSAVYNGGEIPLTVREFNLIYKLLSYPKKTFTRSQLMDEFWDSASSSGPRTVDVYINKLRDKFACCNEFEIVTVHGLGYKAVLK